MYLRRILARGVTSWRVRLLGGKPIYTLRQNSSENKGLFTLNLNIEEHSRKHNEQAAEEHTSALSGDNLTSPTSSSEGRAPTGESEVDAASGTDLEESTFENPYKFMERLSDLGELQNQHEEPLQGEVTRGVTQEDVGKTDQADYIDDIFAHLALQDDGDNTKSPQLDELFTDLARNRTGTIDVDRTDEDLFGEVRRSKAGPDLVAEEKSVFLKIFDSYLTKGEEKPQTGDKLHSEVLLHLQESFSKVNQTGQQSNASQVNSRDAEKMQKAVAAALEPTLTYLLKLQTKKELIDFSSDFFNRYADADYDAAEFYLHRRKGESVAAFNERHRQFCDKINSQSEQHPEKPHLNSLTMPVVFNHILHELSSTKFDGEMALTLFNAVKEDINLYTIVCNQQTYNEMLKVYWVYLGKSTLCEVELIVVEMMNNGFSGDLLTFSTLKEILGTYHTMRMGQSLYNPGGQPIWSKEDEKRAQNLGDKLRAMSIRLKGEQKLDYWNVHR